MVIVSLFVYISVILPLLALVILYKIPKSANNISVHVVKYPIEVKLDFYGESVSGYSVFKWTKTYLINQQAQSTVRKRTQYSI